MIEKPVVSVVIPTHNRRRFLEQTLDALGAQTYPPQRMEVVVVADGCVDDTIAMLESYRAPFALRFVGLPGEGAAAARNRGAGDARGALLLFLDDDVEPSPRLVEAHARSHQEPNRVVVGYYAPIFRRGSSFLHISLAAWWEEKFHMMRRPGHRYTYEDLFSGNFSLSSELFRRVGGFDPTFRMREDYELGLRLLGLNARLIHEPAALGCHRGAVFNLDRSLQRKRHEGQADVLLGLRHPSLRAVLRLSLYGDASPCVESVLVRSVFRMPMATGLAAKTLQYLLAAMELLKMRGFWRILNDRLHGYWYLRGIVDQLNSYEKMREYLDGKSKADEAPDLDLDLRLGLDVAERQLDEARPASVRIRYGEHFIGRIPQRAGAERLRGPHLRPALATAFPLQMLQAIAWENATKGESGAHILSPSDNGEKPGA